MRTPSVSSTATLRLGTPLLLMLRPCGLALRGGLITSGRSPHALNSFPFLLRFRLLDTGPAEDISDHVVALVTRRLIHGPFCFRPRNFRGPRLSPGGGIFDRECVHQYVVRGACETFDEM